MTEILRQRLKPRHVDEVPLDLFGTPDDDLAELVDEQEGA